MRVSLRNGHAYSHTIGASTVQGTWSLASVNGALRARVPEDTAHNTSPEGLPILRNLPGYHMGNNVGNTA